MLEDKDLRENSKNISWNCIAVTCSDPKFRSVLEKEIRILAKAGLLPRHDLLVVVDDPQPSNQSSQPGVGSGGATINALLIVTERLSSLSGATTVNSDLLHDSHILIAHYGRQSYHYCGGNVLYPVGNVSSWIPPSLSRPSPTLLEHTIWMASVIASKSKSGVWVTSLDFYIPFDPSISIPSNFPVDGALVCSLNVSALVEESNEHGFVICGSDRKLKGINYKRVQLIEETECERGVISGTTFFGAALAESIVSLHTLPPLDRCTYYGTDSSTEPVQISLYFDLLLPMCSGTNEQSYVSGELSSKYAKRAKYNTLMFQEGKRARQNIWNQLYKHLAFEHQLSVRSAIYINPSLPFKHTLKHIIDQNILNRDGNIFAEWFNGENFVAVNSLSESSIISASSHKAYLINCCFDRDATLKLKGDCVISDFQVKGNILCLNSEKNIIWQKWPLVGGNEVITCHGYEDSVFSERKFAPFKIMNKSWEDFSADLKLTVDDIWDQESRQTFSKARLFPSGMTLEQQIRTLEIISDLKAECVTKLEEEYVLKWKNCPRVSLEEIVARCELSVLFERRKDTFIMLLKQMIKKKSREFGVSFVPSYKYVSSLSFERCLDILDFLHQVLLEDYSSSSRHLAHVSDLLGSLAGVKGGLRSGPAGNRSWVSAFSSLKEGDYETGIRKLESVCKKFIMGGNPEEIMRAARHYERASHILISKQVETARCKVFPLSVNSSGPVTVNTWVEAKCPARLDLAGGWTDTPPVCYEMGGAVLNVAIKINGKKPIGARARIFEEPSITCTLIDASGTPLKLVWNHLEDLKDYDNPVALGALVKACLVFSEFVSSELVSETLQEQLIRQYKGGLELFVWSELAQGSGLGGSSLLAGTILSVLFVIRGFRPLTMNQLIHATLCIEQMLTTGGGWQDQVGGLIGGIKLGVSGPSIPLEVKVYSVPVSDHILSFLSSRLLLVYTGKVRLARNLLQTVLRNWYAKEAKITRCFRQLFRVALSASEALLLEDVAELGRCIDEYWDLKKSVASGCEPEKVRKFMAYSAPSMLGQCLAGAGGGGYLYGLTSDPGALNEDQLPATLNDMKFDSAEIDVEGLTMTVGGQRVLTAGCDETTLTPDVLKELTSNLIP